MHEVLPVAQHLAAGSDRLAFFSSLIVMGAGFAWYARQQAIQKVELIKQLAALHEERIREFRAVMNDYRELVVSVRDALKDFTHELKETRQDPRHR